MKKSLSLGISGVLFSFSVWAETCWDVESRPSAQVIPFQGQRAQVLGSLTVGELASLTVDALAEEVRPGFGGWSVDLRKSNPAKHELVLKRANPKSSMDIQSAEPVYVEILFKWDPNRRQLIIEFGALAGVREENIRLIWWLFYRAVALSEHSNDFRFHWGLDWLDSLAPVTRLQLNFRSREDWGKLRSYFEDVTLGLQRWEQEGPDFIKDFADESSESRPFLRRYVP